MLEKDMNLELETGSLAHQNSSCGGTVKFVHCGSKESQEQEKQSYAQRSSMKSKIFVPVDQNIASLTSTSILVTRKSRLSTVSYDR